MTLLPTPRILTMEDAFLLFISGSYQGAEFALRPGVEVTIGRSPALEMVIEGDSVGRRHARITWSDGEPFIEDLGSYHGTYLDGEKITKARLEDGCRILIGTHIMRFSRARAATSTPTPAPDGYTAPTSTNDYHISGGISGLLHEVPLPDLLQLLSASRRSGIFRITGTYSGHIHLQEGRIYRATIDDSPGVSSRKALYRLLGLRQGRFEQIPPPPPDEVTREELTGSTEQLLLQGMEQAGLMDELRRRPMAPALDTVLEPVLGRPGEPREEHRSVYRSVCLGIGKVQTLLDRSEESDVEVTRKIIELLEQGWLQKTE